MTIDNLKCSVAVFCGGASPTLAIHDGKIKFQTLLILKLQTSPMLKFQTSLILKFQTSPILKFQTSLILKFQTSPILLMATVPFCDCRYVTVGSLTRN